MKNLGRGRKLTASQLFSQMDFQNTGWLDLENMKALYTPLPQLYKASVRNVFRTFVIEQQSFELSQGEFVKLYHQRYRPSTPLRPRQEHVPPHELKQMFDKRRQHQPFKYFTRSTGASTEDSSL